MWKRQGIWIGFRSGYHSPVQYTLEGVPPAVDAALRERARVSGKSLNEVALEALAQGVGISATPRKRRNLEDIAGSWIEDKAFDEAIADQRQIDEDLWK
jgi:hypothetical protein